MSERSASHATFVIERHYGVAPERVFAAFADPQKKRRWFGEDKGFALAEYSLDFRVGGMERMRLRFKAGQPLPEGTPCANDTYYTDIVPNRRIVIAYAMTVGEHRISSSQGTFELLPSAEGGTTLIYTEQAAFFEGADSPTMRMAGWQGLFDHLERELQR